ncbi:hypothetical protein CC2G_001634 [Coprinopsis cinerea AmutBmut pab1-1]|nr:hypothetical protein CC2G_001634 [Coprinopsis cinerea AmutBmut pab1-1]
MVFLPPGQLPLLERWIPCIPPSPLQICNEPRVDRPLAHGIGSDLDIPPVPCTIPILSPKFGDYHRFTPSTRASASRFTPQSLFTVGRSPRSRTSALRFINKDASSCALVFADGPCSYDKRRSLPGSAVVLGPKSRHICGTHRSAFGVSLGRHERNTSNRAELRAALLAVEVTHWPSEGIDNLIVAMDSQSVVDGIAKWTPEWKRDRKGRVHKRDHMWDQDLWDALRVRIDYLENQGCHVQFWDIPKDWNEADEFAKEVVWVSARLRFDARL